MSAAEPTTAPGAEAVVGLEEGAEAASATALYASVASILEDLGIDPGGAREAYMDCMAYLLSEIDATYFEGAAEAAARKARWGYHASKLGADYLAALLELLLSGSCNREALAQALTDIAGVTGLDDEAAKLLMEHILHGSCGEARYAVAAVLAIPPMPRGAEP